MTQLICEKCGSCYELKKGESLENYDKCDCGGNLQVINKNKEETTESTSNLKNTIKNPSYSRLYTSGKRKSLKVSLILLIICTIFAPVLVFPILAGFISVIKLSNTEHNTAFGAFAALISYFTLMCILIIVNTFLNIETNYIFFILISIFYILFIVILGASGGSIAKKNSLSTKSVDFKDFDDHLHRTKKIMTRAITLFAVNGAYLLIILLIVNVNFNTESTDTTVINNNKTSKESANINSTNADSTNFSSDSGSDHNPNTYEYWYELGKSEGKMGININTYVVGTEWEDAYMTGYNEGYDQYMRIHNAFHA